MKKRTLILPILAVGLMFLALSFTNGVPARFQNTAPDTLPLFAVAARDHKGQSVVTTEGVIRFTTGLHNDYYEVDSNGKTGYLYVETRLSSFLNDIEQRVPLNLCIVIDRSGSMEGIKMGYAKKAAKGIVERLKTEDIVSVVMYDNAVDSVQVPVHVTDKESIYRKIDGIGPRGATNLWGGTEKGYDYVLRNYKPGYVNRVLLISDGLANAGLTDPKLIRIEVQQYKDDSGITLSTFGVGLNYNESLMTEMAETGHGNYYFIDAPQRMAAIFDKELSGLLHVAAQNAELRIKIPKGIKILTGYPLKYQESGDSLTIKLRDLFSEETRGTVFAFSITDGTRDLLRFTSELSYVDVRDGQKKSIRHENLLRPINNSQDYLAHFNKPVVEQVILAKANENLELAMAAADRGDFAASETYVETNSRYFDSNSSYLQTSLELRRMDTINRRYLEDLNHARTLGADSIKRVQKASKNFNYRVRQKKQ